MSISCSQQQCQLIFNNGLIAENDNESICSHTNRKSCRRGFYRQCRRPGLVEVIPEARLRVCCTINCINVESNITKVRCCEIIRPISVRSCNHDVKCCSTRFNRHVISFGGGLVGGHFAESGNSSLQCAVLRAEHPGICMLKSYNVM